MKELSIEEKAKRYDSMFERLKEMYNNNKTNVAARLICERYFPELKKSDDEKIRKALVEMVHDTTGDSLWIDYNVHKEDALAWLEKQGENVSLPKFTFDDVLALQCCMETTKKIQEDKELYEQLQSLHDRLHDAYWLEKKGEQKPAEFDDTNAKRMFIKALERVEEQNNKGYKLTDCDKNSWWEDFKAYTSCIVEQKPWSEEDERLRTSCIKHIEEELERIRNDKYGHSEIISDLKESCRERINWLESLKERYTWRPSDEQMDALHYVTNFDYGGHKSTLVSLYEQLKKLK